MYYNTAKAFLVSFLVSLFTSVIVCLIFFFLVPMSKSGADVVIPDVVKDALVRIPPLEAAEETQVMVQIPLRLKTAFDKWLKSQK